MSSPQPTVAWFGLRFPLYNNLRYTHLIPVLPSVQPWEIRFSNRQLLAKAQFRVYSRYAKAWLDPFIMKRLGRRYPYLLGSVDFAHIDLFPGHVVYDLDDPDFSMDLAGVFNKPKVRAVVTTTRFLKARLEKSGVDRPIVVVPQGVNLSLIDWDRARLVRSAHAADDETVLCVSSPYLFREEESRGDRSREMHCIEPALTAARKLREQFPVRLWLLGQPSAEVREFARHHPYVSLLGFQPPSKLLTYIAAADIALYPRRLDFEGRFSVKLVEYMGCGLPIAATAVGESFVVRDADAGVVAHGQSEQDFVEAVETLVSSPELRRLHSENGRRYAEAHQWSKVAQRYEGEVLNVYCR